MAALLFLLDATRLAFRSMTERRTRALLTIIGIAIGPMALVAVTSVVRGYTGYILGQLESIGQNLIIVTPAQGYRLSQSDLEAIRSLEGVRMASPFYLVYGYVQTGRGEKRVTIYATSIELMFEAIKGIRLREGRIPPPTSFLEAVVGYNIAFQGGSQAYRPGDPLTIRVYQAYRGSIRERRVTVIVAGVVDRFGGALFLSPDDSILLPTQAGERLFGLREWTGILVLAESSREVPTLTRRIKEVYGDSVDVMSFQGVANIVNSIATAMEFVALATSLAAFAVAVAGIAATMITSVMERYREIGVMKAIGFTDMQVLTIILVEALLMSLAGGAIGTTAGAAGAYLLSRQGFTMKGILYQITIKAQPQITPELIALTMATSLAVGAAGGLVPALRAAKIPPAVALRYE